MRGNKNHQTFLYAISRRLPPWLFKFIAGTMYYSEEIKLTCRTLNDFHIRPGTSADLPAVAELTSSSMDFLRRRQQTDDAFYVTTTRDQKVVTVQWAHLGPTYIRGYNLFLDLKPDEAYLYGAFSHPRVRLTGVFNTAFKALLKDLAQRNTRCYFCLVEFYNRPAHMFHKRLNFQAIAEVAYYKIFFLRINTRRDLVSGRFRIRLSLREHRNGDTI